MSTPTRPSRSFGRLLLLPGLFLVLAVLPFVVEPFPISLAGRILAFALVVVSADLLTGYTGLPTLAQVGYFGVGAYTAGLIGVHVTDQALVQLVGAVTVAAVVAFVTGAVAVRTGTIVFLMVTLAIGELLHQTADRLEVTGQSNGLFGIPPVRLWPGGEPVLLAGYTYWWALGVFALGMGAATLVVRSPLGRSMLACRESPTRLNAVGQKTYSVKLFAFTIGGGIAGAGGAAWTAQTRFISPGDLAFSVSVVALLSVVLGGAGTLWGPVAAAAIIFITRDWLASEFFPGNAHLVLGVLFVLGTFLLPRGIFGLTFRSRHDLEASGATT